MPSFTVRVDLHNLPMNHVLNEELGIHVLPPGHGSGSQPETHKGLAGLA